MRDELIMCTSLSKALAERFHKSFQNLSLRRHVPLDRPCSENILVAGTAQGRETPHINLSTYRLHVETRDAY